MKTIFNQDEEALLEEIDRFVVWCLEAGKHQEVLLFPNQYALFKTICKRADKKGIDRANRVRDLDTEMESYKGFQIRPMETGRRSTKKDLGKLF